MIEVPVVMDGSGTVKAWMFVAIEEVKEGMMIREGVYSTA